jgi:EAL and modified HD-GYP domain-containing signal transduction protein
MEVVVARQAIFDRRQKVYGYELLFRSDALSTSFDGTEAALATTQVLSNLLAIGAKQLLGGKKAFVNFDQRLLLQNMHLAFPADSIVIELLETIVPTLDFLALCRSIQQLGYSLALDDFTGQPELAPVAEIANVIKVDMRLSSTAEQERLLQTYKPRGILMLAEKVESHGEFERARCLGYDLFQGYFFARPVVVRGKQISAVKTTCLQLLQEAQKADLDFRHLRDLIRQDTSLTYQLLRYVNSALFAHSEKILSISHALAFLGEERIRRWVYLATLTALGANKPGELVKLSLVRARFCERLAQLTQIGSSNDAFLLGMFSLLDALIDQSLDEALRSVELGEEIAGALLGAGRDDDFLRCVYRLIESYERGNWGEVERLSQGWGISTAAIGQAYIDSAGWAEQVVHEASA